MPKRTIRHGFLVSTYPQGNGYISELIDQFGRSQKTIFSFTEKESNASHLRLVESV